MQKVLVVDDEPVISNLLKSVLEKREYAVQVAENGAQAFEELKGDEYDLVITDVYLPDVNGIEILKRAKKSNPELGVIVMTGQSSIEDAVEAMKAGAHDYLKKGFSLDELTLTIDKFFNYQKLVKENEQLRTELGSRYGIENIIGKSNKIQKIFEIVEMVAPTNATILIQGASGTGKELVAKAIHHKSERCDSPFIRTNCAAIPEGLVESELFGHEKGAFTGAIRTTKGRFELADGGTLLLDEIGEINSIIQAKLLRVLQEREFERVGNPAPMQVDVRIIATTNRDLRKEVDAGNFREDLFYRLNVVPVELPTLQERKEDIPLLVKHFISKYAEQNNRDISTIHDDAMSQLMEYSWPGNVRELENTIERAVVLCKDKVIQKSHLYFEKSATAVENHAVSLPDNLTLQELEERFILQTLKKMNGNRTHAARKLNISIRTLRNKLNEYRNKGLTFE